MRQNRRGNIVALCSFSSVVSAIHGAKGHDRSSVLTLHRQTDPQGHADDNNKPVRVDLTSTTWPHRKLYNNNATTPHRIAHTRDTLTRH